MATGKVQFGVVVSSFNDASKSFMETDLKASGLDDHAMYASPLTTPPVGIPAGWALAAYRIPYFTMDGEILEGMYRDRILYRDSLTKAQLKQQKCAKYRGPAGAALEQRGLTTTEPYLYPHRGPSDLVCITEGEKKAAKVAEMWKCRTIGIGGKDMWSERDGSRVLHGRIVEAITIAEATRIIVVADPDINESEDVRRSYSNLYYRLCGEFPELDIKVMTPPEGCGKVDDWLAENAAGGVDELSEVEGLELNRGAEQLAQDFDLIAKRNRMGEFMGLHPNMENVATLLMKHESLKDMWRRNRDTEHIEHQGRDYREGDMFKTQSVLQRHLHLPLVGKTIVMDAIVYVADHNMYSPICDEIMGYGRWDGKDRFEELFAGLSRNGIAIIRAMFCGYVKRALQPGCHWRIVPILTGPQGVGKTGFADFVAGRADRVYDIHRGDLVREDKDTTHKTMRPGIVRIDDIDSFGSGELGRLKAMITQTSAMIRLPYEREARAFLRRGIMMATTNHKHIIPDDSTGNTRFAVVEIPELLDFERLLAERGQLIAQARELVDGGYTPDDIDFEEMRQFQESSPVRDKLEDFLDDVRTGAIKPDGMSVFKQNEMYYFKAERFWHSFGREPTMYEQKKFKQICLELGMVYYGKGNRIRLAQEQRKNLYAFK